MATKTITLEIEAYNKLVEARLSPKESFSKVVYRAHWPNNGITGMQLMHHIKSFKKLGKSDLAILEDIQMNDKPAKSKWK